MRPVLRERPQLAAYLPPLLLVALIMLVAWHRSGRELNPEILDQADHMRIGLMIAEGRGLTDGARSPLYPAMLAPVATRDHSYYASAKIVTLGLGLVVYLFLAWRIARRWGPGMGTAVLLACGNTLVWTVSGLRVEVLMFPLLFVFWEAGTDGFERGSAWVVAGIAAGLFYLTKANGTVLVAAFILTWLLAGEWRSRRRWLLGLFLIPFAVVIAPLAIYNQVHFGAPFYNFNSHHAMWVDHWDELWVSKTPLPTFETWWAEHGWTDVIARELRGLLVLPDWHWFLIFLGVAVAAGLRLRKERPRQEPDLERDGLTLATTLVVGHLVLLTWFAIVVSSVHHVMPLQPVMAVVIFSEVARSIPERWKLAAVKARPACTALLALVVLAAPFALDLRNLYSQPIRTYPEIEDWVRSGSETCLTYGPSQNFPKWLFTPDLEFVPVPSDVSLEELAEFMRERECRFLLVDAEAVAKRPVLEPLVLDDSAHGLIEATTDHAFRPYLLDPTVPREWVLFEL